ncbi:MAG: YciI family protein, partial [Anaerolineae bacterium]
DPGAWTEEEVRIAEAHFAYLQRATEERIVILAGRSLDGQGPAVVIFEAASQAAAQQFMEGDPFIASGLMLGRLHPFRVALVREPGNA